MKFQKEKQPVGKLWSNLLNVYNAAEYLPDIQRVLKCSLTAHISSVQKTGDRVTADGTGTILGTIHERYRKTAMP